MLRTSEISCAFVVTTLLAGRKMKPRLCLGELNWVEPAIQGKKKQYLVSGLREKKRLTSVSCKLESAVWSRDPGQWIPCFDKYQLIKTWMSNIKDVCCKLQSRTKFYNTLYNTLPSHNVVLANGLRNSR